jgi:formylglycine-generating enzyme required for sulfatase activity
MNHQITNYQSPGHQITRSPNSTDMSIFIPILGGWFTMGSDAGQDDERPAHRVWVDPFSMAEAPVTRTEYAAFLEATGHEPPRDWTAPAFAAPDLPVVGVSWLDAARYCEWMRESGKDGVRLPYEAEWEFAARGGDVMRRYPWGEQIPGWIPNGGRGPLKGPWPARFGERNVFALYGIAANVHEWCADWHSREYYGQSPDRNPRGPDEGVRRASRGGSWRHAFTISRCSARSKLDPTFRYTDYGFRVARSV